MKKTKAEPVITHVEILCRAINDLRCEIEQMKQRCEGKTDNVMVKEMLVDYVTERTTKIEALKTMYFYETGTKYI